MELKPKNYYINLLGCSPSTFYRYCELAMLIPDFETDYPSITPDSPAITDRGITEYQYWVIWSLLQICQRLGFRNVNSAILKDPVFRAKFSKEYYLNTLKNTNENTRLCETTRG